MSSASPSNADTSKPRNRHGRLKMYYGINYDQSDVACDPCDLDGSSFDPNL